MLMMTSQFLVKHFENTFPNWGHFKNNLLHMSL